MGKLYLVPTPIGNLKDITLRAIEVLKSVDIIAAEDTRVTLKLLNHLNIKKSLFSYHQHNEKFKCEEIIKRLKEGKNIALVTDAGMPGISDPGSVVVNRCIEEDVEFEVLPGANAFTTALIYSGMDTTKFLFRGFLPRENKDRKIVIDEIKDSKETLIFYEAPHRLLNTLQYFYETLGNRKVALCRELTKLHEEIIRLPISEAIEFYSEEKKPKGEYVIILEGKSKEEIEAEKKSEWEDLSIEEHIMKYVNEGMRKKDAVKKVAQERGVPKNEIYKYSIDL